MSQEPQRQSSPAALLIPKPREGRAQRAVYVLLATCTVALCLAGEPLSPAAHRVSAHLAALQIGALLKGCCCLAEEIFHLQYRGSFWRALSACFPPRWHLALLLVGGSAYLDLQAGHSAATSSPLPSSHIFLSLPLQKPSAVEISEMTERSQQNVAHGLAWSYYVGYLKIVLPRIKECMEEISRANLNVWACRETWKLHILIPLSCNVWDDLEKADSNIQYLTDLTETTLTRGGIKKRVYKHSLYAIRDGDNQARHCAVEFATPLQTLYAMSQDECAAFSRDDRLEQAKLFYRTLEEILRGSKECAGTYRLIAYEELIEAEPHFLSREILWHLRQQQQEEFTVYEGSPPRTLATALGSTDLSLQISVSDLPQPLRSDHP
uniref:Stimulator of interferon genes protein n=1 Tax=Anas platyrhynchos TaxID=8839 RepID=A0A8B9TBW9_ANAPL